MKRLLLVLSCLMAIHFNLSANNSHNLEEHDAIKRVLKEFSEGYKKRDTARVTSWFEKLFFEDATIIGTYAITPGEREWEHNKGASINLFYRDWSGWGDVDINWQQAHIDFDGNTAWISMPAVITRSPSNSRSSTSQQSFKNMLNNFHSMLSEPPSPEKTKERLLEVAYLANLVAYQYEKGEEFKWPLRISAVLQKKNENWQFRQMHFSYPNRGFPNVRL